MTGARPAEAAVLSALAGRRHSCRAFRPEPLARARIAEMLRIAQTAPSDCNSQSWITHVLSGEPLERLRTALTEAAVAGVPAQPDVPPVERYEGVLQDRRRSCGWALYGAVGVTRGDRAGSARQSLENFRLFGAPHLALITVPAVMAARGIFDAGIYTGFLLLAAEALGIAAVPLASITHHAQVIRRQAGIAPSQAIVCGVAFGTEDASHPANAFRTARADLSECVVWAEQPEDRHAG
ncbi:MAG: nitroreductase [Rubellimicrobium sp.]|nr:nitroreductase [Rubellimicrobium sp.]